MGSRRYRHPQLVGERYKLLREAGLPEHEAILWSYTRAVGSPPHELAEVAGDWWAAGFGYRAAIGWIRVVGKWGCWVARRHVDAGRSPSGGKAERTADRPTPRPRGESEG